MFDPFPIYGGSLILLFVGLMTYKSIKVYQYNKQQKLTEVAEQ